MTCKHEKVSECQSKPYTATAQGWAIWRYFRCDHCGRVHVGKRRTPQSDQSDLVECVSCTLPVVSGESLCKSHLDEIEAQHKEWLEDPARLEAEKSSRDCKLVGHKWEYAYGSYNECRNCGIRG